MKEQTKSASRPSRNLLWIVPVGIYIVRSVLLLIDHRLHPEKFAVSDHPWYLSIVISGAILLAAFVIWKIIIAILNQRGK